MYQRAVLLSLPKSQTIDIEFTDLRYTTKGGYKEGEKTILGGLSGMFKSGELTAIMGPSGAGKSSLLNILTGLQKVNVKGKISYLGINEGVKKEGNTREYRKESCYIQQDDQLHPLFNVNEIMTIAADLKLGNNLNRKAKQMVIDDLLDSLDLSRTKETKCDRLSGGQRKRLSVALELIDNPPVMFLDEPTTGLDSLSTYQCVSMLQTLAKGGRTIVCTIHQPSAAIYEMFDHVYLLAEGKCVYQGAPCNTVDYFNYVGLHCPKYHNPADFMIEVVNKEYGNFNDQLVATAASDQSWRMASSIKPPIAIGKHVAARDINEGKTTVLITPPSEFTRFWILLHRCFVQMFRDWMMTHLKIVVHFLVGVLLGLLFDDSGINGAKTLSNASFLLVSAVYLSYTSLLPAVLRFPSEIPILRKERFNNWYRLKTYYLAFLVSNIPIQVLFAIVFSSVAYFISNQPLEWFRFFMYLGSGILMALTAESMGLVFGTTVNPVNGTFLGAIITAAMLLFSGFLIFFKDMPIYMYYISHLSYLRYGFEGMVQAVYGFNREKLHCPDDINYCHYRSPEAILMDLSMTDCQYWVNILILFGNFVTLRFVTYVTLKRKLSSL